MIGLSATAFRSGVLLTAALCAACSSQPAEAPAAPDTGATATSPASPVPSASSPAPPAETPAALQTLGLEGLGDLRIGEPVPAGSGWASRGAQASDTCATITSDDYPGVYAIVEGGRVRRISAGERSTVRLAEGIGAGAPEAEVRQWFAGFREAPHEYVAAPAKYLTAPNAASGDPALRFEIGADRTVSIIHVGTMPTLGYVEGCS